MVTADDKMAAKLEIEMARVPKKPAAKKVAREAAAKRVPARLWLKGA